MKTFKLSVCLLLLSIFILVVKSCSTTEERESVTNQNEINKEFVGKTSPGITEDEYQQMMRNLRSDIDDILNETKPDNLTLQEYKIKLIDGKLFLPQSAQERILSSSQNLANYGRELASINDIDIDVNDDSEVLALGGLYSPDDDLGKTFTGFARIVSQTGSTIQKSTNTLTWGEVGECAAVAIGADALWALGGSSAATWGAAALTRAFTAVAKRFLGPIGVAIAVVSFGVCIAQQAND
ncbi:hypothetical protein HX13_05705 [Chryseobacterium sp. P1-3]|uniref:hypothetical protein n=1 Tax=Chryseobacterium sp. (strain P1-3) TaxID=1517683 RepID=UPI0004E7A600|nr:hypothetical protein [Chryseobacterium sp. P1-3]KFF75609.1 hypothetical protein HX13_05705 [Chryseobacterium sp. P1-3]